MKWLALRYRPKCLNVSLLFQPPNNAYWIMRVTERWQNVSSMLLFGNYSLTILSSTAQLHLGHIDHLKHYAVKVQVWWVRIKVVLNNIVLCEHY